MKHTDKLIAKGIGAQTSDTRTSLNPKGLGNALRCRERLTQLIEDDVNIKIKNYLLVNNLKDPLHVQRKHQQRAIKEEYVIIALNYGVKTRTFGEVSYTIVDKSLINSPYSIYLSNLRGLTVIGIWRNNLFNLITSYWNYKVKSKKRF